ncbi:MAG: alpha-glucosidase, partial [Promethearchaeota archaeon]
MLKIEPNQAGFKLYYKDQLFLQHSPEKPCFIIGIGNARYKLTHDKFRIKESVSKKIKLTDFKILSNTKKELIILFSKKKEALEITLRENENFLEIIPITTSSEINRLWIAIPATSDEAIYGCGSRFAELNLRGFIIPIWVEDHSPVARSKYSYFPLPTFVSINKNSYFLHVETTFYSEFNFTNDFSHELYVWEVPKKILIAKCDSAIAAVKMLSDYFGRQPAMPEWVYDGLILGIQGGNEVVEKKIEKAINAGVDLAAVWCQDWQGIRMTSFGQQLFWNWEYDTKRYPDLPNFIKSLNKRNIKFLGYMNQFIPTDAPMYKKASKEGYCVKNKENKDYIIYTTDFPTAILDVSNPDAVKWMKNIIKNNMLSIGLAGWMHDYGEYLPTDAVLHSGISAEEYHNQYPVEFAKMAHEILKENEKLENIFIFYRSGFSHVSKYMMCYFSGDQLVEWDEGMGIPTVIPCGISVGICGIGYYCYDIGGYTTYGPYKRTKEMFMRGAEMATFTMVMRTHEGNRPYDNWQHDSDAETLSHLAKMVKIHVHLKPYLKQLSKEYQDEGIPPIRACFLHYESDPELHKTKYQYLFGKDLLIAPVIKPQTFTWKTYFP